MSILRTISVFASSALLTAGSCNGIDCSITNKQKKILAPILSKQLKMKSVEIINIYRLNGWQIIYVDIKISDRVFMFFNGDPLQHRYLTTWSGEAFANEEQEIKNWVIANATGIPEKLASCFAWHVSQNRVQ